MSILQQNSLDTMLTHTGSQPHETSPVPEIVSLESASNYNVMLLGSPTSQNPASTDGSLPATDVATQALVQGSDAMPTLVCDSSPPSITASTEGPLTSVLCQGNPMKEKESPFPFLRYKLQKGLIDPEKLEAKNMEKMSGYLKLLEEIIEPSLCRIRESKLDKVIRRIIKRDDIPRDDEYRLKQRSKVLAREWDGTDSAGSTSTSFDTEVDASIYTDANKEDTNPSSPPEHLKGTEDSESESAGANQGIHPQMESKSQQASSSASPSSGRKRKRIDTTTNRRQTRPKANIQYYKSFENKCLAGSQKRIDEMSAIEANETTLTEDMERIFEEMSRKCNMQIGLAKKMNEGLTKAMETWQGILERNEALETGLQEKIKALKEVKSKKKQVMDSWRGEINEWIEQDDKVTKEVESLK